MAVGIRLRFAGGTPGAVPSRAQHRGSGVARFGRADGLLVDSAGPIDGGWGVIDFWESATEAFDRFTQDRLMQSSNSSATPDFRTRRSARISRSTTSSSTATNQVTRRGCPLPGALGVIIAAT